VEVGGHGAGVANQREDYLLKAMREYKERLAHWHAASARGLRRSGCGRRRRVRAS